ncbi:hypothetical protein [Serratia marcescens]|uniref:hypothetical protein n=1 Tax=Serratia marcescens TaxID=615 RepID=UPI0013DCD70B|nr:hypothetical protein [Serratia marcescens]
MNTDKLSELSKPASWSDERGNLCTNTIKERGMDSKYRQDYEKYSTPLYSQEYVSALKHESAVNWEAAASLNVENQELKKRIAELKQAMRHIHGALLDITVPRVAIAKAAELAVEHAAMKEQSNG